MANLFEPSWDAERDDPPFCWRRARLGRQAGSRELGASLVELPPGAATNPLHAHFANEELLVVVAGRPTLSGGEGETRGLATGEVVAFPAGRAGAHETFWVRDYPPGQTPEDPGLDVSGLKPSD